MPAYTRKDAAYREAKRAGYRSRAAVKLCDLDRKFRLFGAAMRVVDLGCWPGGWLQVAAERVGPRGRVVGIDLAATEPLGLNNVIVLQDDAGAPVARERVREALGGPADLLLSDMAPKLSGVRVADRARHLALVELALEWARELLAPSGSAVIKLFSEVEGDAAKLLRDTFESVQKHRPSSTRKGSSEVYAIARRLRVRA
jgi:23S rRNA (uridine2552-2'-O)-methyltransferase